jgi:hypothetical protein
MDHARAAAAIPVHQVHYGQAGGVSRAIRVGPARPVHGPRAVDGEYHHQAIDQLADDQRRRPNQVRQPHWLIQALVGPGRYQAGLG